MDPLFAFVAKEEILRNVLKTHGVILIIGRSGTGKTVTSLKVALGLGKTCYLSATHPKPATLRFAEGASILKTMADFDGPGAAETLLIVDDAHELASEEKEALKGLLSSEGKACKLLLITSVVMDARDFIPFLDVVVRFRQDTVEMVVSNLRDIHNT